MIELEHESNGQAQIAAQNEVKMLRDELASLNKKLAELQVRNKKVFKELQNIKKQRKDIEQSNIDLKKRLSKSVKSTTVAVKSTLSYQLGDTLIMHSKNPWRLVLLPAALTRVILKHRKKTNALKALALSTSSEISASGISLPPLSEIATVEDRKQLREFFWAAYRSHDIRTSRAIYLRLKTLLNLSPSQREQDYLKKVIDKLPPDVRLLDKITPRIPASIELRPKSICYFLHNSLPYASGGYATRAHGVAQGFISQGYEIDVSTRPGFPLDQKKELTAADVPKTVVVDGINYHRILDPRRDVFKQADYMARAADAVEEMLREIRPSVAIAASNYYTGLPVLMAARRLGIPFIYEVRGFWEITRESREPAFKYTAPYKIQQFMEAELCREADAVFTLTGAMKDELVQRGVPEDLITLLPNACDADTFTPVERSTALLARLDIPDHVPVIGYIGSFVQYEGLDDLATACGILKSRGVEFRLLVVGSENVVGTELGPIAQAITKGAKEGGFEDWLLMPGRVPHDEVPDYYSIVDIAAFPRKAQPVTEMVSPMKSLEAMSMAKSIVVSSVAALAEMVEHGETGLVFQKGDMHDFADKLQLAISDLELRRRLGLNARRWIQENRTWTTTALVANEVLSSIRPNSDRHSGA